MKFVLKAPFLDVHVEGRTIVSLAENEINEWTALELSEHSRKLLLQGDSSVVTQDAFIGWPPRWYRTPRDCIDGLFGPDMPKITMSRTNWAIIQYWDNPYLSHLTQDELGERFADVIGLGSYLKDNKIALTMPADEEQQGFNREWTLLNDVFTESRRRYGVPYPNGYEEVKDREAIVRPLDERRWKLAEKLLSCLRDVDSNRVAIKFGRAEYMMPFFSKGEMRISSASYYAQMQGDNARQDNEMRLVLSQHSSCERKIIKCRDYWMYCMTQCPSNIELATRLLYDFEADSCVVIHDAKKFFEILGTHCQLRRHRLRMPRTKTKHGPVRYVDPVLDDTTPNTLPMTKHFRFLYQKELRMVWMPIKPKAKIPPHIKLSMGSLAGFAECIRL